MFVINDNNLDSDLYKKEIDLANNINNSNFLGNFIRHKNTEYTNYIYFLKSFLDVSK